MANKAELPLIEPVYRTYNFDAIGSALAKDNPSIRNWYLNEVMIIRCTSAFLGGYTSPKLHIIKTLPQTNPYLERKRFELKYLGSGYHTVIKNLIDDGYYVFFHGIDDYYFKGKSWYHEKHFPHDGTIVGYDTEENTYTIYAYDENWILQTFKTSKDSLAKSIKSSRELGYDCYFDAFKVKEDEAVIDPPLILQNLKEYLDSTMEKYPLHKKGVIKGIVVHEYLSIYLDKLYSGEIPSERMDRRVFRSIWNHKKVMLERLEAVEKALSLDNKISSEYAALVKEAENMRMLYASYNHRRRDSLLIGIKEKLKFVYENERRLLTIFVKEMEEAMNSENNAEGVK